MIKKMIKDNINCDDDREYDKLSKLETKFLERVEEIKEKLSAYENISYGN